MFKKNYIFLIVFISIFFVNLELIEAEEYKVGDLVEIINPHGGESKQFYIIADNGPNFFLMSKDKYYENKKYNEVEFFGNNLEFSYLFDFNNNSTSAFIQDLATITYGCDIEDEKYNNYTFEKVEYFNCPSYYDNYLNSFSYTFNADAEVGVFEKSDKPEFKYMLTSYDANDPIFLEKNLNYFLQLLVDKSNLEILRKVNESNSNNANENKDNPTNSNTNNETDSNVNKDNPTNSNTNNETDSNVNEDNPTNSNTNNETDSNVNKDNPTNSNTNNETDSNVNEDNPTNSNTNNNIGNNASSNNNLASLSVNEGVISFNKDITSYNLEVLGENIILSATSEDSKATVTGLGNMKLKYGENIFEINVKAENGSIKTYTVNIKRLEPTNIIIENISIDNYDLNFDKDKLNYSLIVAKNVNQLNIKVTLDTTKYSYEIIGNSSLKNGSIINIIITDIKFNKTLTYEININKEDIENNNIDEQKEKINGSLDIIISISAGIVDVSLLGYIIYKIIYIRKFK